VKINIKPLSINTAFQGKRFKTHAYKAYEKEVMLKLKPMEIPDGDLEIAMQLGFSNKLSDIDNPVKPFIDILQKYYGFNDSRVYALVLMKRIVPKGQEYISFSIHKCFKGE